MFISQSRKLEVSVPFSETALISIKRGRRDQGLLFARAVDRFVDLACPGVPNSRRLPRVMSA